MIEIDNKSVKKKMKGIEFVKKVLEGERDFQNINLEEDFDLSGYEGFPEMQNYLKSQNFEKGPILMNNSNFVKIQAEGIHLPYLQSKNAYFWNSTLNGACLWNANMGNTDFWGANLEKTNLGSSNLDSAYFWDANLWEANLGNSNLRFVNFKRANLWKANLGDSNIIYADFEKANLGYAYLYHANFEKANLVGVQNLEYSLDLNKAKFLQTKVTERERKIIEKKLIYEELFTMV